MNKLYPWLFALAASGLLIFTSGCGGQRLVWSPDGRRGAVLGDKGLYLCDGEGNTSSLLVSNVVMVGWFPDSGRLAVICDSKFDSWPELEKHLDETNRARTSHYAQLTLQDMKAGGDFKSAVGAYDLDDNEKNAVAVYLKGNEDVKKLAGNWKDLQQKEADVYELRVGVVSHSQVSLGSLLFQTLDTPTPMSMRVSPGGADILLSADPEKQRGGARLFVVPVDGSWAAQVVSDDASAYPDWSKDSRSVAYIRAVGAMTKDDDLRLGCLTRRQVVDSAGALQLQTNEDLAGLLFDSNLGVRCLSDGRILFTAMDLHLPVTAQDMPGYADIFAFDPQRQATVSRLVPRQAEETFQHAGFLEVSPDEKKVLIAGDKGAVSVLTLASGEVAVVQAPGTDDEPSFPSWRAGEVCFMVTAPTNSLGRKWEVALWKDGKTKLLSTNWPPEITKGFLDK